MIKLTGGTTSVENGRTQLNVNAPPFIPSLGTRNFPMLASNSREPRNTGYPVSYSAAAQRKPPPVSRPVSDSFPTTDQAKGVKSHENVASFRAPGPIQMKRRKIPTSEIPLDAFLNFKVSDDQPSSSRQTFTANAASRGSSNAKNGVKMVVPFPREGLKDKEEKRAQPDVPRGNILDSSAPVLHKGKQRENPKKKYTRMKKVILNERMQHRQNQNGTHDFATDGPCSQTEDLGNYPGENRPNDERDDVARNGCVNSVVSEDLDNTDHHSDVGITGTSRKQKGWFRGHVIKFCDNVLSKELDEHVTAVIKELGRFQDRNHAKDPEKARLKKRLVYGLREVHKLLKVEKVKCVIIAPNIESVNGEGGLNEMLQDIISLCQQQNVPYVFALSKQKLGYISHKHAPISCAGILNYQGTNELYKTMLELMDEAKRDFAPINGPTSVTSAQ